MLANGFEAVWQHAKFGELCDRLADTVGSYHKKMALDHMVHVQWIDGGAITHWPVAAISGDC